MSQITTTYDPTKDWAGVTSYAHALKSEKPGPTTDDLTAEAAKLYGPHDPAYAAKVFIGPVRNYA